MTAPIRVFFRADASTWIGTGHVMRCVALADALREYGAEILFLCRSMPGDRCDWLERRGFAVHRLDAVTQPLAGVEASPIHISWLGVPIEQEIRELAAVFEKQGLCDWLVVDHYALGNFWERAMRPYSGRILCIDDLADRRHDCDLLLDQNLFPDAEQRYYRLVEATCRVMTGPEFALLQAEYERLHERVPPRMGRVSRLLVFFGGADIAGVTEETLTVLKKVARQDLLIDVVIGSANPRKSNLIDLAGDMPNVTVHVDVPTLAPLMASADFAIGAAGATSWERCCLGLPAAVLAVADNQVPIARALHDAGAVRLLGSVGQLNKDHLAAEFRQLLEDDLPEDWSLRCMGLVDGQGAHRVATAMLASERMELHLREAALHDEPWIVRSVIKSKRLGVANKEDIKAVFRKNMRSVDGYQSYVAQGRRGIPVAEIRVSRTSGNHWEMSVLLESLQNSNCGFIEQLEKLALLHFRASRPGDIPVCMGEGKGLTISVCSDKESWVTPFVANLMLVWVHAGFRVSWTHSDKTLPEGDICFFLSYSRVVKSDVLARHLSNIVVHASDLPRGRGWSPLTWQVLEGQGEVIVSLLEAADSVDSGEIYLQQKIELNGTELIDELRLNVGRVTEDLCRSFVAGYPDIRKNGRPQQGTPSYYPRRRPEHSRIDVALPLVSQFNLLRTVDNDNYPAWFELGGYKYLVKIEKAASSDRH